MNELSNGVESGTGSVERVNFNVDIDLAKTVGNLISPANKILDMIRDAFGIVGHPLHKMLDGKADAYVMDENAEVMEKHTGIPIEYSNGNIRMSTNQLDAFHQRVVLHEWSQAKQREANIENITTKALDKVKDAPQVDRQLPDQDWLLRFFTSAQDICTEEMQDIWASILAGTAKNSKAYSLRTLTTLHNMSKYDAELFMKICSHTMKIVNYVLVPRYDKSNIGSSISLDDILHLSECGLLNSSSTISYNMKIFKNKEAAYVLNDEYVLLIRGKQEEAEFTIPQYPLTIPGKELSTLFTHQPMLDESKRFAAFIMHENRNILEKYSMHRITGRFDNDQIQYEPMPLVSL